MTPFSFDCETFLIQPGLQAPPIVCGQFKYPEQRAEIIHARDPAWFRTLRTALESQEPVNGHNVAFDAIANMAYFPDLRDLVFDKYARGQVLCTIVGQKLLDIASGNFKILSKRGYALDTVGAKYGVTVDKTDPWRLRYGELYNVPVAQWDPAAVSYALADADAQDAVFQGVVSKAIAEQVPLVDWGRQSYAALWLRLMSTWGIQVDLQRAEEYMANVRAGLEIDRETCAEHGLYVLGSLKIAPAMRRMVACCEARGADELPLTAAGEREFAATGLSSTWAWWDTIKGSDKTVEGISLDEDAVIEFGDEVLEARQRAYTATLQLARAELLWLAARAGKPVQSRFGELQDTGRPSCNQGDKRKPGQLPTAYGAQLFNPAKDKKVKRKDGSTFVRKGTREIYVPRKSTAYVSTDWEGAEASGVAQVCIWLLGFSKMAEVINAGGNLPTEFGALIAGMPKEEAYALRKAGGPEADKFDAGPRQSAKIALYGYFADMGPATLAMQARMLYRVDMSEQEAATLKEKLKVFAPELPLYWKWGKSKLDKVILDRQGKPKLDRWGRPMKVCSRITQFWSGRIRGMLSYTELLNNMFQALVSDIFKLAGSRLAYECYTGRYWDNRGGTSPMYGCRVVNAPYDDFLTEVPLDRLTEAGQRQCEIMTESSREVSPDVAYRVEPSAMTRWFKNAATVRDQNGRLLPWEPK